MRTFPACIEMFGEIIFLYIFICCIPSRAHLSCITIRFLLVTTPHSLMYSLPYTLLHFITLLSLSFQFSFVDYCQFFLNILLNYL
jgi:hypothetical protein